MAVRKNTSERLEKTKCSVANVDTASREPAEEHCPWYVAITRLLVMLAIVGIMFVFFCMLLRAGFSLIDKSIVEWCEALQQSHPLIFYGTLLVGYVIFLISFINQFANCAINSIVNPSPSIEEEKEEKNKKLERNKK